MNPSSDIFSLSGKVAIVTGSSRGIGRAIAEQLAARGAKVVISSRKLEACEEVARSIRDTGGQAQAIACNISDRRDLEKLVRESMAAYGQIDILVCNAATNPVYGASLDLTEEAFDKILATNVKGVLWLANLVLPQMAERHSGSVIIVSSILGVRGTPTIGAYAVSKAAEAQLARNLAIEWGHANIRINSIAPGLIKTDFARALWENPKLAKAVESATPLGRIGEPEDIAGVAVFLASPAAKFITGQFIVVDGGITISGGGL